MTYSLTSRDKEYSDISGVKRDFRSQKDRAFQRILVVWEEQSWNKKKTSQVIKVTRNGMSYRGSKKFTYEQIVRDVDYCIEFFVRDIEYDFEDGYEEKTQKYREEVVTEGLRERLLQAVKEIDFVFIPFESPDVKETSIERNYEYAERISGARELIRQLDANTFFWDSMSARNVVKTLKDVVDMIEHGRPTKRY